jgi:DNA-binding MurR/RpiR family transcriptional regulator
MSAAPNQAGSALALLRSRHAAMTPTEQRISSTVLADPETMLRLPVSDIARRAGTSPAAVSRFTAKMGYRGLSDFKIALALDVAGGGAVDAAEPGAPGEAGEHMLAVIARENRQAIRDTLEIMPAEQFARAVSQIGAADRILVMGVGQMGYLAKDAAGKLTMAGKNAVGSADYVEQLALSRGLGQRDVLLCIAYEGSSPPVAYNAEIARLAGATVIGVCRAGASPLSELADIHLPVSAQEGGWRSAASAAHVAITTVVDALLAGVLAADAAAADSWRATSALVAGEQLE